MEQDEDFKPCAHICLYFSDGEAHMDIEQVGTCTPDELAEAMGDACRKMTLQFYKEIADADANGPRVQ